MGFTFHVVGLPHTVTSKEFCACAYTQKVYNFCKMMTGLGHTVFHYGAEGSNPPCAKHTTILSAKEQTKFFGKHNPQKLYNLSYDPSQRYWQLCNHRAAAAIVERYQPRDFLCLIAGVAQSPIANGLPPDIMTVEYGIGYRGVFAKNRVFESYAQMHMQYGGEHVDPTGNAYHAVIPNYFDPHEFPLVKKKKDYFLFVGRLIQRKGLGIAVDVTKHLEAPLKIAGQGATSWNPGQLVDSNGVTYTGDHLDYLGHVNVAKRAEIMGNAKALFAPTLYAEPFGGVVVEAQLCGTPVITTDWGAFPETVEHGKTGYRCRTLEQFIWAAKNVDKLDPTYIHKRAVSRYSLDRVAKMYDEYFSMLADLWDKGWETLRPERKSLAWLE